MLLNMVSNQQQVVAPLLQIVAPKPAHQMQLLVAVVMEEE